MSTTTAAKKKKGVFGRLKSQFGKRKKQLQRGIRKRQVRRTESKKEKTEAQGRFLFLRLQNLQEEENQIRAKGVKDSDDFRRLNEIAAEKLRLEPERGRKLRQSTRRSARLSKQQERLERMQTASSDEINFEHGTDIRSMLTNLDILHSELEYARSELNGAEDEDDVRAIADYINCVQKDAMKEQAEIQCSTCKKGRHARKVKSGLYAEPVGAAFDEEEEEDDTPLPEYQSGIADSLYEIDRLSKELDDVYYEAPDGYQEAEAQIQAGIFGELAKIQCNTCGGKNKGGKKKKKAMTSSSYSSRIRERLDVEDSMRVLDLNTGEYDIL